MPGSKKPKTEKEEKHMDREKIDAYLVNSGADAAFDPNSELHLPKFLKGSTELGAKTGMKRLPTKEAYLETEPKDKDSYQAAYQNSKDALLRCGRLLEEDTFSGKITGIVFAGMKDMSPAVLVIQVEQENLKISAYAKEGLISQHTAEKAIDKFVQAL